LIGHELVVLEGLALLRGEPAPGHRPGDIRHRITSFSRPS
jgi:hypothetical protein